MLFQFALVIWLNVFLLMSKPFWVIILNPRQAFPEEDNCFSLYVLLSFDLSDLCLVLDLNFQSCTSSHFCKWSS